MRIISSPHTACVSCVWWHSKWETAKPAQPQWCVYMWMTKNFRKILSYFRLKGRWYDYCLGKVFNQKLIEERAGEDCEAI
jgi:hypothetical protein